MSKERSYRRSKDGIKWHKITFMRMKLDAWKQDPRFALLAIEKVRLSIDTPFGNGYTYGRIPEQKQEETK